MDEYTDNVLIEEPEEVIEAALSVALKDTCQATVVGAILGGVLDFDTFVSVVVDLSSQDLDSRETASFVTLSAVVSVRVSQADDPNWEFFRDECRRVRNCLVGLTGDKCALLGNDKYAVDSFKVDQTSTEFSDGDSPIKTKKYTASVRCRALKNTKGVS